MGSMQRMIEQFCAAIDRAFKGDPEKTQAAVRIFSEVVERYHGVVLVRRPESK